MLPDDVWRMAMWWGPGALLFALFVYGLLRLGRLWIEESMDSKRRQTEALLDMLRQHVEQFVSAQKSQAEALARLAGSVDRSDSRESLEHQQILIALKAIHREIEGRER